MDDSDLLLEELRRANALSNEAHRAKSEIFRKARDLGIDVDWLKRGAIVSRKLSRHPRPRPLRLPYDPSRWAVIQGGNTDEPLRKSFIYFAVNPISGLLKVGISFNPKDRVRSLETPNNPLLLWVVFEGSRADEASCHKALARYCVGGEWFRMAPDCLVACSRIFSSRQIVVGPPPGEAQATFGPSACARAP